MIRLRTQYARAARQLGKPGATLPLTTPTKSRASRRGGRGGRSPRVKPMLSSPRIEKENSERALTVVGQQGGLTESDRDNIKELLHNLKTRNAATASETRLAGGRSSRDLEDVWSELRRKKERIASLSKTFQQLRLRMRAEKQVQVNALDTCRRYKEQLRLAQQKLLEYNRRMKDYDMQSEHLSALEAMLADTRAEKEELERRVRSLHENALTGDRLEERRIEDIISKYKVKSEKQLKALRSVKQEVEKLRKGTRTLKAEADDEKQTAEKYRLLHLESEDKLMRTHKAMGMLKERLKIFQAGGLTGDTSLEDLERALEIVRREKESPSYVSGIDDPDSKAPPTVPRLQRELHDLLGKHKSTLTDLKSKKDMLTVQQRIVEDNRTALAAKDAEIARLKKMVARGGQQIALRDLIADDASMFSVTSSINRGRRLETSSVLSGRSEVVSTIQNILSLRITKANLDTSLPHILTPDPLSCVVAEFYEYEPSNSGFYGGFSPEYKFTVQYRVQMDTFTIAYLQTAQASVELLLQDPKSPEGLRSVGTARVPIGAVLEAGTARGKAPIYYTDDEKTQIGTIEYRLGMLWPMEPKTAGRRRSTVGRGEESLRERLGQDSKAGPMS